MRPAITVAADFRAEVDELHAFLRTLTAADWSRPTGFKSWTPRDVVAHLHHTDQLAMSSVEGEAAFAAQRETFARARSEGRSMREMGRERFAHLDDPALLETWRGYAHELAAKLEAQEPKKRLPWFGPDMGVAMFTTARLMETWAHGQEVYDLLGAQRTPTDRLRHVATIGVKTFGWAFVNRGLDVPDVVPGVQLTGPSGDAWEWGKADGDELVRGHALDFCQVVTQVRNVADTELEVRGPVAVRWMSIAQCFAGAPADPPPPGTRGPGR